MKKTKSVNHAFYACALALVLITGCGSGAVRETFSSDAKLAEINGDFTKKIHQVAPGVYSAVGYAIANSIMLVGGDGVVIVDAMEDLRSAREVYAEFRKISPLPVKAIVYTHSHPDHIYGGPVFAAGGKPEVYAHETLARNVERLASETAPVIGIRSMRMFGNYLQKDEHINAGIGPFQGYDKDTELDYLPPTKTFAQNLKIKIAGIDLELIHAPGETDDQIYVWLPNQKILLSGDNFYRAFPNLYTIRGTWFRSLKHWYRSIDIIRALKPEHIVPSHGLPVSGAEKILAATTDYRDAIQYVHDQTLRGINAGMHPDELVEFVRLPDHLAKSPYLQEYYGKVSWSVRSLFDGNLGWFSGDPADLQPLSRARQAALLRDLAGGTDKLIAECEKRAAQKEYQAVLQLSGHILRLEPKNQKAKEMRITALMQLGLAEQNANARHYYLTEAHELKENFVSKMPFKPSPALLKRLPNAVVLQSFITNLNGDATRDTNLAAALRFKDTNEEFTIRIRRGVAELSDGLAADAEIVVELESQLWKELLTRNRNAVVTLVRFTYKKGNSLAFARFLRNFEPLAPRLTFEQNP